MVCVSLAAVSERIITASDVVNAEERTERRKQTTLVVVLAKTVEGKEKKSSTSTATGVEPPKELLG